MLVLAFGLFALSPAPLLPARRSPLAPRRAAACRCAQSVKGFSPAYDTTVRYAAVDWARNLRTLPGSLILRRIKSPLVFNIGITMVICVIHAAVKASGRMWPTIIPLPHTLLSSALGLLLVFRTNAAYDRFWEARKQWGIVTTECRALASLACTYMTSQQVMYDPSPSPSPSPSPTPSPNPYPNPNQAMPMLTLAAAFPVVMKNYL